MDANRRLTDKMLRYWLNLRQDRPFPRVSDIFPDELGEDWDFCFIVEKHKNSYIYSHLGTNLLTAFGGDFTDPEVAKMQSSQFTKHLLKKFDEVLKTRKPVRDEEESKNSKNITIKYRLELLPVAGYEGHLNYILGGMRWKPC